METRTYKVYKFSELPEESKQKALDNYRDINIDYKWWDYIYDDAETIGCRIKGFDDYKCDLEFYEDPEDVARLILEHHGQLCDTYQDATNFFEDYDNCPQYDKLCDDFQHALSEAYRIYLRNEYERLTSDETVQETLEINEYDFTEDGRIN